MDSLYLADNESNLTIVRSSLVHLPEDWEHHVADRYCDCAGVTVTSTMCHNFIDSQRATAHTRYKTRNKRFKN